MLLIARRSRPISTDSCGRRGGAGRVIVRGSSGDRQVEPLADRGAHRRGTRRDRAAGTRRAAEEDPPWGTARTSRRYARTRAGVTWRSAPWVWRGECRRRRPRAGAGGADHAAAHGSTWSATPRRAFPGAAGRRRCASGGCAVAPVVGAAVPPDGRAGARSRMRGARRRAGGEPELFAELLAAAPEAPVRRGRSARRPSRHSSRAAAGRRRCVRAGLPPVTGGNPLRRAPCSRRSWPSGSRRPSKWQPG